MGAATFAGRPTGLKNALLHFLSTLGIEYSPQEIRVRGHSVPLGGEERVLHSGRVLLAGDAASLAEPMTGEGIFYAVKSAQIAAETVCDALLNSPVDLVPYTTRINEEITEDLKYARRLSSLLYRFPRLCFRFFVRSSAVQWGMANVLYGRSSYKRLYYNLLKSAPRLLLDGLR